MSINNGGPAFPMVNSDGLPTLLQGEINPNLAIGVTIRDYFAAKAIQGMIAEEYGAKVAAQQWARDAYEVADAMLRAREPLADKGEGK